MILCKRSSIAADGYQVRKLKSGELVWIDGNSNSDREPWIHAGLRQTGGSTATLPPFELAINSQLLADGNGDSQLDSQLLAGKIARITAVTRLFCSHAKWIM